MIASSQGVLAQSRTAHKPQKVPLDPIFGSLEDPIFGLSYDTSVVRYEEVPSWLDKKCHIGRDHSFIHAHVRNKGSELFIVMSYSSDQDGDSFGNSFWVKGAECKGDSSNWTLSGKLPERGYGLLSRSWEGLPGNGALELCDDNPCRGNYHWVLRSPAEEAVLRSLVQDGIQRAVKAFGRAQFGKQVCSAQAISEESDYPIVQQELRKFCSSPL
jgi:hypothetical protein